MPFIKSLLPPLFQFLIPASLLYYRSCYFTQLPDGWWETQPAAKITPLYHDSLLLRQELLPPFSLLLTIFSPSPVMDNCAWSCNYHRRHNCKTWSCLGSCHLDGNLFSYSSRDCVFWSYNLYIRYDRASLFWLVLSPLLSIQWCNLSY